MGEEIMKSSESYIALEADVIQGLDREGFDNGRGFLHFRCATNGSAFRVGIEVRKDLFNGGRDHLFER